MTINRDGSGLFLCLNAVPVIFAGVRNRKEHGERSLKQRDCIDANPADLDRFGGGVRPFRSTMIAAAAE